MTINIFKKGTTNFYQSGTPINAVDCTLEMEINSTWQVNLTLPLHEQGADLVDYGAVLEVPSPYGYQLYMIVDFDKSLSKVTAIAYPFAMVLLQKSVFHYDTRPENTDCQTALTRLLEPISNTNFKSFKDTYGNECSLSAYSDITTQKTAYWQLMTGIDALNGDDENTLISRWGGEIKWDNFTVSVLDHLGKTTTERNWEFPITVGFNCEDMNVEYDYSDVVTRVIPKAYNGYLLPEETGRYVESTKSDKPAFPTYKVIEYSNIKYIDDASSSSDDEDVIVFSTLDSMYAYMRQVARDEFKVNHIDDPAFVCDVSLIDLYNNSKYERFKDQLKLGLGDYLTVYNEDLQVEVEARVTKLTYDCILGQSTDITIGSVGKNYFTDTTDLNRAVSKCVSTSKSALQLDSATGILHGNDKGVIATGTPIKEGCDTWWDIESGEASFGDEVTFGGTINTNKNIYAGGNIYMQDLDGNGYKYGRICLGRYDEKNKTVDRSSLKNTPALNMQSEDSLSIASLNTNWFETENSDNSAYVRVLNNNGSLSATLLAGNTASTSTMSVVDVKQDYIQFGAAKKIQVYCNGQLGVGLTGSFKNVTGLTVIGGFVTGVKTES
jgi:phage minor structural protein